MDTLSHGLWGAIVAGRKTRRDFWAAFAFGVLPDVLSFGIVFASVIFEFNQHVLGEPPPMESIPAYVFLLYNITHSLIVFVAVFGIVWVVRRRVYWPLAAWGLHILVDIPTHAYAFFPTPFLWPVSDFKIDGMPWSSPYIFIPNVVLLGVLYAWFFIQRRRARIAKERYVKKRV
ncbi:MAG: hypothetical protein AAB805_00625 [Patescibacteria group bacterium]